MPLYVDACALAKRYLPEGGSSQIMRAVMSRPARWGGMFVSSFVEPEVISAFAKFVRERSIPFQKRQALAQHPQTVDLFRKELRGSVFQIVDTTRSLVEGASVLLRNNPEWKIGAADALHLATATRLRTETDIVFVSADRGLIAAAQATGFRVYNPDRQPLSELESLIAPPSSS